MQVKHNKLSHNRLSQLFYIDEIQTLAKDDNEQKNLLDGVKTIGEVITIEFEIDKYAKSPTKAVKKNKQTNEDYMFRT